MIPDIKLESGSGVACLIEVLSGKLHSRVATRPIFLRGFTIGEIKLVWVKQMKVSYNAKANAAYIRLSNKRPYGAIEIDEDIIVHVTKDNKIVVIEILGASHKFSVQQFFKFEVENARPVHSR